MVLSLLLEKIKSFTHEICESILRLGNIKVKAPVNSTSYICPESEVAFIEPNIQPGELLTRKAYGYQQCPNWEIHSWSECERKVYDATDVTDETDLYDLYDRSEVQWKSRKLAKQAF